MALDASQKDPPAEGEDQRREIFAQYLTANGLKSTRQRHAIAEVFFNSNAHLTVEELLALVRKKQPDVGYATVYRTLKLLADAGLADERHFSDGVARYEQTHEEEHHDHMVCTKCGKVIEFIDHEIEELQEDVAEKYHFEMTSHKLELYGVCKDCRKK